jgi:hypothetical protein
MQVLRLALRVESLEQALVNVLQRMPKRIYIYIYLELLQLELLTIMSNNGSYESGL